MNNLSSASNIVGAGGLVIASLLGFSETSNIKTMENEVNSIPKKIPCLITSEVSLYNGDVIWEDFHRNYLNSEKTFSHNPIIESDAVSKFHFKKRFKMKVKVKSVKRLQPKIV